MQKLLKDISTQFHLLPKWKQRISWWYVISVSLILVQYFINRQLDIHTYFHPFISIMINILVIIDIFLIPVILVVIEILSEKMNLLLKLIQIFLSIAGVGIITLILSMMFFMTNKSAISSNTVNISFSTNKVYIENDVWLESRNHIDVYQIENLIFIKKISSY